MFAACLSSNGLIVPIKPARGCSDIACLTDLLRIVRNKTLGRDLETTLVNRARLTLPEV